MTGWVGQDYQIRVRGVLFRGFACAEAESRLRRTPDAEDRRRLLLTPTSEGSACLDDLEHRTQQVQEELLVALDGDEREQLRLLLDKVLAAHPAQPA